MKTIRISAVELDLLTPATALVQIKQFLQTPETKYVLTPNAGQLVSYRENLKLRNFLLNANLRLIDGWPLAVAVSLAEGKKWPRVTGSDLLPKLFGDLDSKVKVGIIGGTDGSSVLTQLKNKFPNLNLVLVNDEIWDETANNSKKIAELCEASNVELLILALGHPKQELLAEDLSKQKISVLKLVLCFGASVDFLVGSQKRAPEFLQKIGFEWLYRLLLNPKKFAKRYLLAIWPSLILLVSAIRIRFFKN